MGHNSILCTLSHNENEQPILAFAALLFSIGLSGQKLVVLGTLQDAGSPQLLCEKECCAHQNQTTTFPALA